MNAMTSAHFIHRSKYVRFPIKMTLVYYVRSYTAKVREAEPELKVLGVSCSVKELAVEWTKSMGVLATSLVS